MQRLVLFLSVRIFLAAYAKKILLFYPSPFLPSLSPARMLLKTATNVIKKIAPRRFVLWLITIVKADNFVWRDHGLIHVIITFFCRPLFLIPSRSFSTWAPHGPKFLHVNSTKGCFAFKDLPPSSVVNSRYINFLCSLCLGQFQLQVLSRCGHSVHEDAPDKVRSSLR